MADPLRGKTFGVPVGRRIVTEFLRAGRSIPLVSLRRDFTIPNVVEARNARTPSISWVCIFAKAYALAARRHYHLRWNWLTFPWARIYEHPTSECAVVVEREWAGEKVALAARVRAPEDKSLVEFDEHVRRFRDAPVLEVSPFRQLLRIARMPGFVRRFLFWSSLNCSGYKRCKRFGTFAVSSLGPYGSETLTPVVPLTTYLTYGPISPEGRVSVGVIFDHRVMDGGHAARALEDTERIMNSLVAAELRALARDSAWHVEPLSDGPAKPHRLSL